MHHDDYSKLRQTVENSVTFLDKNRPFPVSPTPMVIPAAEYRHISGLAEHVLTALEKTARVVLDTPHLWAQFPELHSVEEFVRLPSSTTRVIDLARFDLAVRAGGGVRMMESNSGCPGGLTTIGDINAAYATSTAFDETLAGRVEEQVIDSKFYFVDHLASLVPDGLPKTLAFISSRHRRIVTDLDRLTELAAERGYGAIRCDVQDLDYRNGALVLNGTQIQSAFLKFDSVVTADGHIDLGIYGPDDDAGTPFLQAVKDRAIAYVNSFASQLLIENKRLLAMVRAPEVQADLTEAETSALTALVAPTYSLAPGALEAFGGRDRLLAEKDHWVLKAVIETRGRGVHIGRFLTAGEWMEVVASPVLDRFVAQEFIALDVQDVRTPVQEEPGLFKAYTDIGLFLLSGKAVGFLCRASRSPVVNVGKSGALRPTYVVTK